MTTGDKVRVIDSAMTREEHKHAPQFYPKPGTVGRVTSPSGNNRDVWVKWPDGSTSGDDTWACKIENLEVIEDNEAIPETAYGIKDSGDRTQFSTGAVRDMHIGKGRMDLLPWRAVIAVSQHCENGAIKYGEHNVDRGIPASSLIDSGLRHAAKFVSGDTDEDHLLAACWNFLWALQMRFTHPELMNVPWREYAEEKEKEG